MHIYHRIFCELKYQRFYATLDNMNAVQIIEEIQKLPDEEREKVVDFVLHVPNKETLEAINENLDGRPRFKSAKELFKHLDQAASDA